MRCRCLIVVAYAIFLFLPVLFPLSCAVSPSGANVTKGVSSSAPEDDPTGVAAVAGNVTQLNIDGYSNTQSWQGYYGNVTGTIQLADSGDNVMYNWSLASPRGEVYAANVSSLNWTGISCYDMNEHETLEEAFGIESDDVDGVNETFNRNDHEEFYTNNKHFAAGECNNTKLYGPDGTGVFDEVLLSDGDNPIFTSLLQDNTLGFDGSLYDFQMLVLEDGHGTDTATDTYYFWVELE